MQKFRNYEGLPPLPVDAPREVATVDVATPNVDEAEDSEGDEVNDEAPPTPGRHQHESSSSQQLPSSTVADAVAGESLLLTTSRITGSRASHAIVIDDDGGSPLPGKKHSRGPSGNSKAAEAKKSKKQKAQGREAATAKPSLQQPLSIQPLASAPPKDSGKETATGASPTPALKQAKLKFRGIPR